MSGKRGKPITAPYKLMMILLYGQHKWIDRNGPITVLPVATAAKHMRTRANRINEYLTQLETWGFLSFTWYKHFAKITIETPVGMAYDLGEIVDVEATNG